MKSTVSASKNIFNLIVSLFSLILLNSCQLFDSNMKEFFEYYTDNAGVGTIKFPDLSGVSINGLKCVSSEGNKIISFVMRNPQQYDLDIGYEFEDSEVSDCFLSGGYEIETYQSEDKYRGQIVFPKEFLNALEMGNAVDHLGKIHKNLSGKILLTDIASGRSFDTFDVNFMVNTKPERVRGAMFQLDTDVVNDGTYIVCFNLANLNGTVHQIDTHDLYIGNNHWKLDGSQRDLKITEVYKEDPELELTKTKPAVYNLDGTASSFEELSAEGYVPLYFKTNKKHASSTDAVTYNISIIDDDGLSVTSVVSNQADQLQAPTINVVDDSVNPAHELTEKFTLVINHERATWHKNEDGSVSPGALSSDYPYIKYKVTKGPQVVASGIKRGRVEVELASAKGYKVEAFSYLDGYVDSDDIEPAEFAVSRSVNYYVSQNEQADATGSRNSPYGTFEECINEINNQITTFGINRTEYNIYVMTDLTNKGLNVSLPSYNYKLNIYGYGKMRKISSTEDYIFKINNSDIHIENLLLTGKSAMYITNSTLYLKNVQVKGCNITSGTMSAIQVKNGTFTLDGCTVSGNTITGESTLPAGIYAQTDVTLKGTNVIYGNEIISGGVSSPSNLFLATKSSGKLCLIKPDGPIGAETKIGVSAAVTPTAGHPVVISSGYGYKTSTSSQFNKKPGLYFKGDLNGVSALDDEICLAVSGVSSRPFVYEDDIQFQLFEGDSSTDYKFTIGNAASFNIKPLHDNDGTPYYFDTDELEDVIWDVYVTNHSSPTGVSSQTSQITIPDRAPFNIAPDKYELHINMTVPTYSEKYDCYITRTYSGMHIITGEKQQ